MLYSQRFHKTQELSINGEMIMFYVLLDILRENSGYLQSILVEICRVVAKGKREPSEHQKPSISWLFSLLGSKMNQ